MTMFSDSTQPSIENLACPLCQQPYRPGELLCPACGTVLSTGGKTRKLDAAPKDALMSKPRPQIGRVLQQELTFEIEGKPVVLPGQGTFTVGRLTPLKAPNPDIDLSPFQAEAKGISRLHIKIQWRGILIYVSDLKSTNGTLLNNRPLTPGAERILRHNDDLQLGSLKIKVKIEDLSARFTLP